MLFILFVVLAVLGIAAMTERLTRNCGGERKLLSLCAVFSYGVLYGLERGNLLLLCWPLMAFFIVNRKSKNPVIRELSYIAPVSYTHLDVTRLISARMATEFERGLYYGKNE